MTIEQGIYERLLALASLTALVGTRVYQMKLPQSPALPAVRVQRISGVGRQHLRGPDGLFRSRVQIDAYAQETGDWYTSVTAVAAAVRGNGAGTLATGVWGWMGELGGSPPAILVRNIELMHDGLPALEAGELRLARVRQDYMVHWTMVM